jgi:hypothetical protein
MTSAQLLELLDKIRCQNSLIKQVYLKHKRLPTAYLIALLNAVANSIYVTKLKISRVGAGDELADALALCFQQSSTLVELNISKNDITCTGCIKIANALKGGGEDCPVQKLNLDSCQIGDKGVKELCEAIPSTKIAHLKLGKNNFSLVGLQHITMALRRSDCPLTSLDLRSTGFGDAGALLLARALKENKTLVALHLDRNEIHNTGLELLADALTRNNTLQALGLKHNLFEDEGAEHLVSCIPYNNSLTKLELRGTAVSEAIKEWLLDLLLVNAHGPQLAEKTKRALNSLIKDVTSGSDDFGTECVICFENASDSALLPCKHHNCCADCASKLKQCHMCREMVVRIVPIDPAAVTSIDYLM